MTKYGRRTTHHEPRATNKLAAVPFNTTRTPLTRQWVVAPADPRATDLARSLRVSPLLAQVLINRGISDYRAGAAFLRPKLTDLIAPEQMPGVNQAALRIKDAVQNKQKITIYGDYDVDGIAGAAILWQLLRLLGAEVDYYIPHRIEEGYGLNTEAVRSLAQNGTQLLVTVDCGITAFKSAALAAQLGLDLIVTDHHQPEPQLPNTAALVHPALSSDYPNQDSAGAMVAFKLAWALANQFSHGRKLDAQLREFMLNATSLAAMGTIADVVDLRGENRVLTWYGLKSLPVSKLPGIQALIDSAGLTGRGLDSYDIGFRLAPMLNAAGRMGHARLAVELLTSDKPSRAMEIAEYLKQQNGERQRRERSIFKQACEMIVAAGANHPDKRSIVLADQRWHTGVIGIVASRIVDKFFRPTIMMNVGADGIAAGSGRSIPGFCLLSALKACSEHLLSFGGHAKAAGLTIRADRIERFTADFEAYASRNLDRADLVAAFHIDADATLRDLSRDAVRELQMLGPFGPGNPKPVFTTRAVRLASPPRRVGAANDHLQLVIADGISTVRCVGFGLARLEKKLIESDCFHIAYQPQINDYNGNSNVEFVLSDVQFE